MVPTNNQSLQIRASAAAWLARLRSEKHTPLDEEAFQEWLAADAAHAAAFDTMNAVWDAARPLHRALPKKNPIIAQRINRRAVFGGVAVAAGLGGSFVFMEMAQAEVYRTEIGEQKQVRLRDGSQLFLDTDTKVKIALGGNKRNAVLEYGCANFRLTSDASRPFCLNVIDNQIISHLSSTFDVRRDGDTTSILLLRGQAEVKFKRLGDMAPRILSGGDRLITMRNSVKLDKPDLLPLLAWHTGQAMFRDETLLQATAEMNRYSTLRLEIKDARVQDLKVSGVYRVGDNMVFAQALATLLPIAIHAYDDHIEIIGDEKKLRQI